MLFNEPKLLKTDAGKGRNVCLAVSVLFNEPKLLKTQKPSRSLASGGGFSALQRAEIAEKHCYHDSIRGLVGFSALQRAEIAEKPRVFGLFRDRARFSALQRAEIAEKRLAVEENAEVFTFQCSSTSRNC